MADTDKKEKIADFDKAERIVLDRISKTGAAVQPLMDAIGLVTAADIYAPTDIPSFASSKVDGFALRSADTAGASPEKPAALVLIGSVHAGLSSGLSLKSGEAVKITTGALVPEGADCIVKSEDCLLQDQTVRLDKPCPAGRNIQPRGGVKKSGELLIPKNKRLRALEIEALASCAITEVSVYKKPVVAIIATGDELTEPGRLPPEGKRINSNAYLLAALSKETNADFIIYPPVSDDAAAINQAILNAGDADIIITTGGTADSEHDHMLKVLQELGAVHLNKIAVKPGQHFIFATIGEKPVFALPGTPTACLVLFELFIRPAIRKLQGLSVTLRERSRAVSFSSVKKSSSLRTFIGANIKSLRGKRFVEIDKKPAFGTLASMLDMNGLVILHENTKQVSPKDEVDILTLYPDDVAELDSELSLPEQALPQSGSLPVVSFVGKSNSGKTTLIEKVISELCARGYRVGSIKHDAHHFEIDLPGKDSYRHREAGARMVVISSPDKIATVRKLTAERTMDELVELFGDTVDIIVTEGFKRAGKPKIEVLRRECSKTLICSPAELLAIASDIKFDINVPGFDINDHKGLTDLIECKFLEPDRPGQPAGYLHG